MPLFSAALTFFNIKNILNVLGGNDPKAGVPSRKKKVLSGEMNILGAYGQNN